MYGRSINNYSGYFDDKVIVRRDLGIGISTELESKFSFLSTGLQFKNPRTTDSYFFKDSVSVTTFSVDNSSNTKSAGTLMAANGIDLAQIQVILLKKVEELTFYIIEQQKQIAQLKIRVRHIKHR